MSEIERLLAEPDQIPLDSVPYGLLNRVSDAFAVKDAELADCKADYLCRHNEAVDHFETCIRLRAALKKLFYRHPPLPVLTDEEYEMIRPFISDSGQTDGGPESG